MSKVSFVKIQENEAKAVKQAILESLKLISYSFTKGIKNIVIKPNLCYYWDYSTGQTTDPRFVEAIVEILREQISHDVNISIIESDASAMKCKYAFPLLGYKKLAEQNDLRLVNLAEDKTTSTTLTVGGRDFDLPIPETIQAADLRINVPKIKYMNKVKVSSAMKNIFGCNPLPLKYKFHPLLHETIVALTKIMKFHLHILDGVVLLGVFPRKTNLVMASRDPVAFDAAACRIAGHNPRNIRYLTLAQNEGIGNMDYAATGLGSEVFEKSFPRPKLSDKFVSSAYTLAVKTGILRN